MSKTDKQENSSSDEDDYLGQTQNQSNDQDNILNWESNFKRVKNQKYNNKPRKKITYYYTPTKYFMVMIPSQASTDLANMTTAQILKSFQRFVKRELKVYYQYINRQKEFEMFFNASMVLPLTDSKTTDTFYLIATSIDFPGQTGSFQIELEECLGLQDPTNLEKSQRKIQVDVRSYVQPRSIHKQMENNMFKLFEAQAHNAENPYYCLFRAFFSKDQKLEKWKDQQNLVYNFFTGKNESTQITLNDTNFAKAFGLSLDQDDRCQLIRTWYIIDAFRKGAVIPNHWNNMADEAKIHMKFNTNSRIQQNHKFFPNFNYLMYPNPEEVTTNTKYNDHVVTKSCEIMHKIVGNQENNVDHDFRPSEIKQAQDFFQFVKETEQQDAETLKNQMKQLKKMITKQEEKNKNQRNKRFVKEIPNLFYMKHPDVFIATKKVSVDFFQEKKSGQNQNFNTSFSKYARFVKSNEKKLVLKIVPKELDFDSSLNQQQRQNSRFLTSVQDLDSYTILGSGRHSTQKRKFFFVQKQLEHRRYDYNVQKIGLFVNVHQRTPFIHNLPENEYYYPELLGEKDDDDVEQYDKTQEQLEKEKEIPESSRMMKKVVKSHEKLLELISKKNFSSRQIKISMINVLNAKYDWRDQDIDNFYKFDHIDVHGFLKSKSVSKELKNKINFLNKKLKVLSYAQSSSTIFDEIKTLIPKEFKAEVHPATEEYIQYYKEIRSRLQKERENSVVNSQQNDFDDSDSGDDQDPKKFEKEHENIFQASFDDGEEEDEIQDKVQIDNPNDESDRKTKTQSSDKSFKRQFRLQSKSGSDSEESQSQQSQFLKKSQRQIKKNLSSQFEKEDKKSQSKLSKKSQKSKSRSIDNQQSNTGGFQKKTFTEIHSDDQDDQDEKEDAAAKSLKFGKYKEQPKQPQQIKVEDGSEGNQKARKLVQKNNKLGDRARKIQMKKAKSLLANLKNKIATFEISQHLHKQNMTEIRKQMQEIMKGQEFKSDSQRDQSDWEQLFAKLKTLEIRLLKPIEKKIDDFNKKKNESLNQNSAYLKKQRSSQKKKRKIEQKFEDVLSNDKFKHFIFKFRAITEKKEFNRGMEYSNFPIYIQKEIKRQLIQQKRLVLDKTTKKFQFAAIKFQLDFQDYYSNFFITFFTSESRKKLGNYKYEQNNQQIEEMKAILEGTQKFHQFIFEKEINEQINQLGFKEFIDTSLLRQVKKQMEKQLEEQSRKSSNEQRLKDQQLNKQLGQNPVIFMKNLLENEDQMIKDQKILQKRKKSSLKSQKPEQIKILKSQKKDKKDDSDTSEIIQSTDNEEPFDYDFSERLKNRFVSKQQRKVEFYQFNIDLIDYQTDKIFKKHCGISYQSTRKLSYKNTQILMEMLKLKMQLNQKKDEIDIPIQKLIKFRSGKQELWNMRTDDLRSKIVKIQLTFLNPDPQQNGGPQQYSYVWTFKPMIKRRHIFIAGPPNVGKTFMIKYILTHFYACEFAGNADWYPDANFKIRYSQIICLDAMRKPETNERFRKGNLKLQHIERMCDNTFFFDVKHGGFSQKDGPYKDTQTLFICSNYLPAQIFKELSTATQRGIFRERFKIINLYKKFKMQAPKQFVGEYDYARENIFDQIQRQALQKIKETNELKRKATSQLQQIEQLSHENKKLKTTGKSRSRSTEKKGSETQSHLEESELHQNFYEFLKKYLINEKSSGCFLKDKKIWEDLKNWFMNLYKRKEDLSISQKIKFMKMFKKTINPQSKLWKNEISKHYQPLLKRQTQSFQFYSQQSIQSELRVKRGDQSK